MKVFFIVRNAPPVCSARAVQLGHWLRFLNAETRVICKHGAYLRPGGSSAAASAQRPFLRRLASSTLRSLLPVSFDNARSAQHLASVFLHHFGKTPFAEDSVLFTVSKSEDCHLAGLALKRKTGLPWAAFFSDPWTDNSYFQVRGPDLPIQRFFEKRVVENADLLLFPTEEFRDYFMSKYPKHRHKTGLVPQCFDPSLYPAESTLKRDPGIYLIRHIGHLYGARRPFALIEAFRDFETAFPEKAAVLRFEFIGNCSSYPEEIAWPKWRQFFKFTPTVAHETGLRLMKEADRLLALDGFTGENIYRPSKLIEYLGAGRPLWAICQRRGPTEAFVNKLPGCMISSLTEPKSIFAALHQLYDCWRDRSGSGWQCPPEIYETYAAASIVSKLQESLRALLRKIKEERR